jgi:hypothetical protein
MSLSPEIILLAAFNPLFHTPASELLVHKAKQSERLDFNIRRLVHDQIKSRVQHFRFNNLNSSLTFGIVLSYPHIGLHGLVHN